jgi:hypothetical protein
VSAGLEPLGDDRIDAGRRGRCRLCNRAHLREHADARPLRLLDVRRHVAPEEEKDWHALLDAGVHLAALEERQEQTRPEGLRRPPASVADLLADGGRGEPAHAEEPEASGVGDGGDELGSGVAASERRGEDRVLDRKIAAETSLQHVASSAQTHVSHTRLPRPLEDRHERSADLRRYP